MSNLNMSTRAGERRTTPVGVPAMDLGPEHAQPEALPTRSCASDEAGAIAAAMRVFEDGLSRLITQGTEAPVPETAATEPADVTGLLAAIAGQTSLMALRASLAASGDGATERGFAAAAAEVRSLAGQMARATDALVAQVGQIQAAAERAQDAAVAERHASARNAAA